MYKRPSSSTSSVCFPFPSSRALAQLSSILKSNTKPSSISFNYQQTNCLIHHNATYDSTLLSYHTLDLHFAPRYQADAPQTKATHHTELLNVARTLSVLRHTRMVSRSTFTALSHSCCRSALIALRCNTNSTCVSRLHSKLTPCWLGCLTKTHHLRADSSPP